MITADDGEDGWTAADDDQEAFSSADRAAELVMLNRGVDTLRGAVAQRHERGTLEFALFAVARVLEETARASAYGEEVPAAVYRATLDIARHLDDHGVEVADGLHVTAKPV